MTTTSLPATSLPSAAPTIVMNGRAVLLTLLVGYGALAATWLSALVPFAMALPWWLLGRSLRRAPAPAQRVFVVAACTVGATLLGVALVQWPQVHGPVSAHPAFGDHPVAVRAGFPWPGVEGNGHGLAQDRVPFAMGVDALLANALAFTAVFALGLRRVAAARLAAWVPWVARFAAVASLVGGWALVLLFD